MKYMIKDLLGFSLILIGIIEMGNFFAHHGTNVSDGKQHALAGVIMCIVGVFLLKTTVSFNGWTKFYG